MSGIALDGVGEVGDEVSTALVLRLNICPLLSNDFFLFDELVVSAAGQTESSHKGEKDRFDCLHNCKWFKMSDDYVSI
jgi:hypothetical protein